MNTDPKPRSSLAPLIVVAAMVLLSVGYVLSVGPAVWLHRRGYLSDSGLIIYVPLEWLHENCPPVRPPLERYVELWQ